MKRKDIQKCALCGQGVMSTGLPFFYTVKVNRMVIDNKAVQQVSGLEQMMGSVQIAQAIGTDPDVATVLTEGKTVWVCENCAIDMYPIAELAVRFNMEE